jgi:hypothetical protein
MIDPQTKIRFYHTPKAGGTTIFNMTQGWKNFKRAHPQQNHVKIKDYPPKLDETGLTIIRHPYSRFESAFYHMVDACKDDFYYRHAKVSDCETLRKHDINFDVFQEDPNEFLLALMNSQHPYHHEAEIVFNTFSVFRPQFYWLANGFGTDIHHQLRIILRQENLKQEFEQVARQLGHPMPKWPTDFMSNKRLTKTTTTLNERSKSYLNELYRDDFKHFNFDPDPTYY